MKYPIYSYRDNKVGFGNPICDMNDQSAIRGFSYAVNQNNGLMNFSPKDFDLFKLGEFDSSTGVISSLKVPVLVVSGSSVFSEG